MTTTPLETTHLGRVILDAIEASGRTVRSAALEAGIPPSTLDRKIKTNPGGLTLAELGRIASLLGTTVAGLTESAGGAA